MPFHLPHIGHSHSHSHSRSGSRSGTPNESQAELAAVSSPSATSADPVSPTSELRHPARTDTSITSSSISTNSSSGATPIQGILKRSTENSESGSSFGRTNSSSSASAFLGKKMSGLTTLDRYDTIDSARSDQEREGDDDDDDDRNTEPSTPGTSVSSLSQCPLPPSSATQKFPFFVMTLSSTSTLSFLALPLAIRPMVLEAVNKAWRKGVSKVGQVEYAPELMKKHKEKGCEGGVWEVTMKDNCWMPNSQDKVSSKRILINLFTVFAREGYNLTSSFRTSSKDSGKDTMIFLRGEPDPDPIFFAVAFHSSDRVWIIDAEADVGQALEDGLKHAWVDGIQSARTRERHCREIKLRGSPWNAHSTSALISARCIHLFIMKSITHFSRGYDFVGSVDMADMDEGEMPVTFYRKKWGASRAVWAMAGEMEAALEKAQ